MQINNKIKVATLLAIYASLLMVFKWGYLPKSLLALTGLLTLPFLSWQVAQATSSRYVWPGLGLAILSVILPSNMLFWFACGFAAMAAVEGFLGRTNYLPVFLMVVISPVFRYISDVWSFPIRLKMSDLAAKSLSLIGFQAKASGNVIVMDGTDFHVDSACMGLHSLSTGLLLSLLVMAYFERKKANHLGFGEAGAWLVLALILAISANFMRMLALVIFKVPATDPMHDGWGLFAVVAYVMLPMFVFMRWRFAKIEVKPMLQSSHFQPQTSLKTWLPHVIIISMLLFTGWKFDQLSSKVSDIAPQVQLTGFQRTVQKDGVLKFENDSLLVYLKPPVSWLNASHDPRICWQGSGYEFKHIKKEKIAGIEFYSASLENGSEQLYTAWWYTDGSTTDLDEWTWRWSALFGKGKGYWLVNVTAVDYNSLKTKLPLIADESRAAIAKH
ncbi:MAG: exosortase N [Saprospiraceae bacterium]|nr:exosortase N [Saprospiraceae bacterium]